MSKFNIKHLVIVTGSVLLLSAFVVSCGKKDTGKGPGAARGAMKFPVETSVVQSRNVQFSVNAVGSVEAFETVQVTAKVSGVVERVLFREGDAVKAGAALIEIEPERYDLAVRSADAQLAKARAEHEEAQSGLKRRQELNQRNPDLVKQEDIDSWQARTSVAAASLAQAEAALRIAELNRSDSHAAAPITGIIQTRDVQTGQYVQPGALIATMVRRDPLLVRFTVPELDAARMSKGMTATFHVRGSSREYKARVSSVAESASEATRLVSITAEVTDPDRAQLRPGSFAEITVDLGENRDMPVIPQTAIRPSDRGFLSFVIRDSTAHERVLTLGSRSADGYVEVRAGLKVGDLVVIRGAEALREGVPVKIAKPDAKKDTTGRSDR